MGIDDISGKVSAFWVKAKSALSSTPSDQPSASKETARPAGDSVDLPNKGQYFAGYAFPQANPAEGTAETSRSEGGPEGGESKVWAPLVIAPFDPPKDAE